MKRKIKYSNFNKDRKLEKEIDVFYRDLLDKLEKKLNKLYYDIDRIRVKIDRKDFIKLLLSDDSFFDKIKDIAKNSKTNFDLFTNEKFNREWETTNAPIDHDELFEVQLSKMFNKNDQISVEFPIESITDIVKFNQDNIDSAMKIRNTIKEVKDEWMYLTYRDIENKKLGI